MTILEPPEDVFSILEEAQLPSIKEPSPPIKKFGSNKPQRKTTEASEDKKDPIDEEINQLFLDYLMLASKEKKRGIQKKTGFKEFMEERASSIRVIERLNFKKAEPEQQATSERETTESDKEEVKNPSLSLDVTKTLTKRREDQKKNTNTDPVVTKILARKSETREENIEQSPVTKQILTKKSEAKEKNVTPGPFITKILTRQSEAQKEDTDTTPTIKSLFEQSETQKEEHKPSRFVAKMLAKYRGAKKEEPETSTSPVTKILSRRVELQKEDTSTNPVVTEIHSKNEQAQKEEAKTDPTITKILTRKSEIKEDDTSTAPLVKQILPTVYKNQDEDTNTDPAIKILSRKSEVQTDDVKKDSDSKQIPITTHKTQALDTNDMLEIKKNLSEKRPQVIDFRGLTEEITLDQNETNKNANNSENSTSDAKLSASKDGPTEKTSKKKKKKKKSKLNKEEVDSSASGKNGAESKVQNLENSSIKEEADKNKAASKPKSNRKNKCEDYISEYKIPYSLKTGLLVSGEFRVNANARWEGFITPDCGTHGNDILIPGYINQNRAISGDLVAVQLFSKEEGHKEINATFNSYFAKHFIKRGLRVGKVVRILNRDPSLTFVGTILPSGFEKSKGNNEQESPDTEAYKDCKSYIFIPANNRIPFFVIPKREVSAVLTENWGTFKNQIFEAKIAEWKKYERHPVGRLIKCLGPMGDLKSTHRNILIDNTIIDRPFSKLVLSDLPQTPYIIKAKHMKDRMDFRKECVFTIDPSTARDLDDAVSIKQLPNGNFQVGVHIADVSHFITPGSALDKEALRRGTSTYLVNRVIPMLPELLCQDLCSLNPGVDRLTFSVVWELDPEGNRVTTTFAKAVIQSCCRLAYEDAQEVIESKNLPSDLTVYGDHQVSTIEKNIMDLFNLSRKMRKRRFDAGAVQINKFKLSIKLDEKGFPESFYTYQGKESNKLIEEFMLLANMSVAEKIYEEYPTEAMMRSHPEPIPGRLDIFSHYTDEIHMPFYGESSSALTKYFDAIEDPVKRFCLENLAIKTFLMRAKYLCNSRKSEPSILHHFALNVDHYTHFTSPIRRYPDIVVHRQLMSILTGSKEFDHGANKESVSDIAHQCNSTKFKAKTAQEQSNQLYLAHYIHRRVNQTKKPIPTTGYIFYLDRNCMEVVIPEYALEETFKWETNFNYDGIMYGSTGVTLNTRRDLDVIKNRPILNITTPQFQEPLKEYNETHDDNETHEDKDTNEIKPPFKPLEVEKIGKNEKDEKDELFELYKNPIITTFELFGTIPLLLSVSMDHVTPRIRVYVDDLPIHVPKF